jgi:phosphatidylserine decarboxylase
MTQKFFPFKIHKDGYLFIGIFIAVSALVGMLWSALGWICAIITVWCIAFFRDPDRVTPVNENYIISPADGVIQKIEEVNIPAGLSIKESGKRVRISIFLGLLDVHVNRSPVSGTVTQIKYVDGKFFYAALDKASEHNERNYVVVTLKNGKNVIFTQIAGVVARRILCEIKKGKKIQAGERYGLIRFGSRMDIYLPKGEVPKVVEEQRVIAGETILSIMGNKDIVHGETR